jgi:hypothetical protein
VSQSTLLQLHIKCKCSVAVNKMRRYITITILDNIHCSIFLNTKFRRLDSFSVSNWNLLSLCLIKRRMREWLHRCRFSWLDTSSGWVASFKSHSLCHRDEHPLPFGYDLGEVGWVTKPIWTTRRNEHFWRYRDSNADPSIVQPVPSVYTDRDLPVKVKNTRGSISAKTKRKIKMKPK